MVPACKRCTTAISHLIPALYHEFMPYPSTFSSSSLVSASHIHNYTVPRYLKRPFAISRNHYHYHYTTCASQLQNINLFHSLSSTSKISVLVWWDIPYIPPHSNKRKDKMSCHSVQISLIQALLENKSYDISPKPTGGSGRRLTYPI